MSKIHINDIIIFFRKHTKNESIINEVFNKDSYMLNKLELKEDSIVIDIGAQIGCFVVRAAKIAKKGKFTVLNPNRKILTFLRKM